MTHFSVEITSQKLAEIMQMVRDQGQPTRVTLNGIGAVIYQNGSPQGQVRQAALLEKRLREVDPSATVRRVSNI